MLFTNSLEQNPSREMKTSAVRQEITRFDGSRMSIWSHTLSKLINPEINLKMIALISVCTVFKDTNLQINKPHVLVRLQKRDSRCSLFGVHWHSKGILHATSRRSLLHWSKQSKVTAASYVVLALIPFQIRQVAREHTHTHTHAQEKCPWSSRLNTTVKELTPGDDHTRWNTDHLPCRCYSPKKNATDRHTDRHGRAHEVS